MQANLQPRPPIGILATPISSVGPSIISSVTFDIKDFDIECPYDIDVVHLRYRMSISKVFDIEGHILQYVNFDIEGDKPSISKVVNRDVDIEVSCLLYRTNIL